MKRAEDFDFDAVLTCFINKIDIATKEEIKKAEDLVIGMNPHAEIAYMSAETGEGIAYACDLIEQKTSSRYDDAVEAERLKQEYKEA